jgi:Zn-finger nucleic acid-binding protein
MSERQGVEIDFCPDCRGVWLDRGELDKIIERAVPQAQSPPPQPQHAAHPNMHAHGQAPGYGHGYSHGDQPHRKKSFLQELFD